MGENTKVTIEKDPKNLTENVPEVHFDTVKPSTTLDDAPNNVQTVFKNIAEETSSHILLKPEIEIAPDKLPVNTQEPIRINSESSASPQPIRCQHKIVHNQSDIFWLPDQNTKQSIWSVNGTPSRRLYHSRAMPSNVFPVVTDGKPIETNDSLRETVTGKKASEKNIEGRRPSTAVRNPLTGTGLISLDEFKCKTHNRKDGNPLLGVGYTSAPTQSTHRIPPGGFSHQLW